ncbi:hypothetical protein [Ferruginibacter sp.]
MNLKMETTRESFFRTGKVINYLFTKTINMETKLLKHQQVFVNPEFEAFFKKLEREQLDLAGIAGRQDGLANKPTSARHYNIQVVSSIKAAIQKAIDFNYSLFKPVSAIAITKEMRTTEAENILLLEKDKNAKEKKLLSLKSEQAELRGSINYIAAKLKIIIPALFGLAEGILVYTILQSAGFPLIVRFFLSFVIGLTGTYGVNLGANFISKAVNKKSWKKRFAVVITLAFAVAAGLGVWRAGLYSGSVTINSQIDLTSSGNQTTSFSSLPFILISFISFLVALAFELKHWQTDEQKARIKLYKEKVAEGKKIELESHVINNKIKIAKENVSAASGEALVIQEYAYSNECRLITLAQQIQNYYESSNIEHRLDNTCPPFFGESISKEFKLYFNNLFTHLKQKK